MYLARSLSALLATAAMAAEVPVSQPAYAPAPRDQYYAAAASNGDQYLVVWPDERSDVRQLYAARISGDGRVLDPNGFRVASRDLAYAPSVIWGGNAWFVFSNTCTEIRLVRVAGNGVVLDSTPRRFPARGWCPGFSLATDGRHVVVGYLAELTAYEKRALIVNSDGEAVADIRLSDGDAEAAAPAIAFDGSSFLAVWNGRAVRFDRNGVLGPAREVSFSGSAVSTTRIASNGGDFLITRGGLVFRMTSDSVVQHVNLLPFADVRSIDWTGSGWLISGAVPSNDGQYRNVIRIVLLDRDGHVVLGQGELQSEGRNGLLNTAPVATNGRNLLAAWQDVTEAPDAVYRDNDTYASILSLPDLAPGPRRLVSVAARWQRRPSTAASGSNQLTVWEEQSGIYARRHWRNGATDPAPLRLTAAATSTAVVFDGSDYIVASTEGSAVVTRRLPVSGELRVDREARWESAQHGPGHVALASDGEVTLAAWLDGDIHAARIGSDGSFIDPLQVAPLDYAATHRIAISPSGKGEFLVVWGGSSPVCICSPPRAAEGSTLQAARVTAAGMVLDRPAIDVAIPVSPYGTNDDPLHSLFVDHPSVTWNGNEWLVVWNRSFGETVAGTPYSREEIRGRRIARNGTRLDGSARDPGVLIAPQGFAPTVAWTGSTYLLGWYEGSPNYRGGYASDWEQQWIRTATFDRPGGPLSNVRTLGEATHEDLFSFAVANGFVGIAYARLGEDSRYGGVSRAFVELPRVDSRRRTVRR